MSYFASGRSMDTVDRMLGFSSRIAPLTCVGSTKLRKTSPKKASSDPNAADDWHFSRLFSASNTGSSFSLPVAPGFVNHRPTVSTFISNRSCPSMVNCPSICHDAEPESSSCRWAGESRTTIRRAACRPSPFSEPAIRRSRKDCISSRRGRQPCQPSAQMPGKTSLKARPRKPSTAAVMPLATARTSRRVANPSEEPAKLQKAAVPKACRPVTRTLSRSTSIQGPKASSQRATARRARPRLSRPSSAGTSNFTARITSTAVLRGFRAKYMTRRYSQSCWSRSG
mmetsp:Transcript_25171/g.56703  ORF Transcript_25171/g.56703 Transcript_25171/m.56703 type:complete len:283 (+) Transcript_25171:229-1077(+)